MPTLRELRNHKRSDIVEGIEQHGGVRKVALRQAAPEADAIFGEAARWVRSEALVRLDLGKRRQGLLVFGAEDPHRFGPEHGVDLLTFFGGVVERQLRQWLYPGE